MEERRWARVGLGVALLVPAALTASAWATWPGDGVSVGAGQGTVAWSDDSGRSSLRVTAETEVPYAPKGIAVGDGSLWVTTYDGVLRLDAQTVEVQGQTAEHQSFIDGGHGLVVSRGRIWVVSPTTVDGHDSGDYRGAVVRIDPETMGADGEVRDEADTPSEIVAVRGDVWVSTGEALKLVDHHARAYDRTVKLGRPAGGLTAAGGALWVASSTDGVILRVDPRHGTVRTFDLGGKRQHLRIVAGSDGALWAADDRELIELDPSTGSARRELSPPGPFRTAALADGVLWLYGEDGVRALDAASGDVLGRVELPGRNLGQIVAAGSVAWITDYVNSRVRRVELSREGADRERAAARRAERLCAEPGSIAGDFDGDHRPDRAHHTYVGAEGARLGVCTAAGDVHEIDGAGQAEGTLRAVDLNGDSRDELVFGATTVSQSLAAVAVLETVGCRW